MQLTEICEPLSQILPSNRDLHQYLLRQHHCLAFFPYRLLIPVRKCFVSERLTCETPSLSRQPVRPSLSRHANNLSLARYLALERPRPEDLSSGRDPCSMIAPRLGQ